MVLTHRRAALLSARRIELCDLVDRTLFYLHPDTRVHSFLSPLPYEVNDSILLLCFIAKLTGKINIYKIISSVLTQSFALIFRISDYLGDLFCFDRELCDMICQICQLSTSFARAIRSLKPEPGGSIVLLHRSGSLTLSSALNRTSPELAFD